MEMMRKVRTLLRSPYKRERLWRINIWIYASLYMRREGTLSPDVWMTRLRVLVSREGSRDMTAAVTTTWGGGVEVGGRIPGVRLQRRQDIRRHLLQRYYYY